MEIQRMYVAKTTLKKKKKVGGLTLLDLKTSFIATATKTAKYWHKNRQFSRTK